MKRDARIGLAVVLVLGLTVTLLVGRAIYKRSPQPTLDGDAEIAGNDNVPSSSNVSNRVDPIDPALSNPPQPATSTASLNPGAATNPLPMPNPVQDLPGTRAAPPIPTNTSVQRLLEDQGHVGRNVGALPGTSQPTRGHDNGVTNPQPLTPPSNPPVIDEAWGDHEQPVLSTHGESQEPKEGYGYTVAPGDNMWKISAKVYGDGKYTQKILEANPHLNSAKMKPGAIVRIPLIDKKTVLMKLPSFSEAGKPAPEAVPAHALNGQVAASTEAKAPETGPTEATKHKIEQGETLSSIAKKYFGTGGPKTIARIVAANKGLEPSKLKVGQEINIPAVAKQ